MKINVAKSAGFCFGVRRAINLALDTARSGKEVCMLGDIVHNEEVVKEIQAAGIHKIKRLCPGKSKIFLVRAHGISIAAENKAKKLGFKIIDATCPMVKEIHKTAKEMEQAGYRIIIIGDKLHDEVIGIAGQLKSKAIVIDGIKSLPVKTLKDIQRAAIVVQSTQNIENVKKIVEVLQKYIKNLKFFNTICAPTRNKQAEIRSMPQKNDVMVIIGSKTSANTKRLYEISKSLNPKSYWVNSVRDLKKDWFRNAQTVGISAGASTPELTTHAIIEHIRHYA